MKLFNKHQRKSIHSLRIAKQSRAKQQKKEKKSAGDQRAEVKWITHSKNMIGPSGRRVEVVCASQLAQTDMCALLNCKVAWNESQ